MPIEIREIIIKTEISSGGKQTSSALKEEDIHFFRKQLLEECKRMIAEKTKKNSYKR
jgi:nitrogenase molybdenum-iron protein alpha/beta subunit